MVMIREVVFVTLVVFGAVATAMKEEDILMTDEHVGSINAKSKNWVASTVQNSFLRGATKRQVMGLMGVHRTGFTLPLKTDYPTNTSGLPEQFDSASKWPNCPTIQKIRDQSACGSCWAFGAAEGISDRYCTYGGPSNLSISANDVLSCCTECGDGCNGGNPDAAWGYWVTNGLVDNSCDPYPFPTCEHHVPRNHYPVCPQGEFPTPPCQKSCNNSASWQNSLHFGKHSWSLQGESAFMHELYNNGPFEVALEVYSDFPAYKGGVYKHTTGDYLGGHAVRLVGWGTLNGEKYWKIANSWNEDWGINGYFLILRGVDECGIEDSGSAGEPKL